ncbi:uncharacterized protein METZ01_LOCUS479504, partial [marine metagenome]
MRKSYIFGLKFAQTGFLALIMGLLI